MGTQTILARGVAICLGLIALAHCIPVEVVYTGGNGCECPTKLDYQISIPKIPKPKKYIPAEYGYKIDVPPAQAKAKLSYTFDFTVEEPLKPSPVPPSSKWDLYAKVDRIAVNKGDCEDSYAAPSAPAPCTCGQYGKPRYRYVYKNILPCKCKRPKCKCNLQRSPKPYIPYPSMRDLDLEQPNEARVNNIRRKRELPGGFFRRRIAEKERPGKIVKLYNKKLPTKREADEITPTKGLLKRNGRKRLFPFQRQRLVKRDIKGEYDLLEKERERMDLTLPEIIQYMPETLHPNFKRGQCYVGCTRCSKKDDIPRGFTMHEEAASLAPENSEQNATTDGKHISKETHEKQDSYNKSNDRLDNRLYNTKRNAANYGNHGSPYRNLAASALPLASFEAKQQSAYGASFPPHLFANPMYALQSVYPAQLPQLTTTPPRYEYTSDSVRPNNWENVERFRYMTPSALIPDPSGAGLAPLQYAGDLEMPAHIYSPHMEQEPIVGAPKYSVQHVSNEDIDRVIHDIIYRHPDFIEASSHYGGALVDPEPWQERETKSFLKKLIDGRLSLWFGRGDDFSRASYAPSAYSNPYDPMSHPDLRLY